VDQTVTEKHEGERGIMRKIAYLIGLAALMSSAALATTATANLGVSASITSNCTIGTSALAFGAYDPIAGTAVPGTGTVTVACTSDVTAPKVTLGQGLHAGGGSTDAAPLRRLSDGAGTPHYLTYNIYLLGDHATVWDNVTGQTAHAGDGTGHDLTTFGQIDINQHTAPAGSYADTVVATVTF
jgi:spore coat protein U-like protein